MTTETQQQIAAALQKLEAASAEINCLFINNVLPATAATRAHFQDIIGHKHKRIAELNELVAKHEATIEKLHRQVRELQAAPKGTIMEAFTNHALRKKITELEQQLSYKDGQIAELRAQLNPAD